MGDTFEGDGAATAGQVIADIVRLWSHSAHALWSSCLVGNPVPAVAARYERMSNPVPGDLVLELSTYRRDPWDPGALGRLLRTAMEPFPDQDPDEDPRLEQVWYVRPFVPAADGKWEVRWFNADFVAIPDGPQWGHRPDPVRDVLSAAAATAVKAFP